MCPDRYTKQMHAFEQSKVRSLAKSESDMRYCDSRQAKNGK